MKTLLISFLIIFQSKSQNFIPFRNTLNEANFWFYEQKYDSACYYYGLAEKFENKFYVMESHLYSRSLWEINDKKKSIQILLMNGVKEKFINDTTFYLGMSNNERYKITSQLKLQESDYRVEDQPFFDSIAFRDQKYRKQLYEIDNDSTHYLYKSIWKQIHINDSINELEVLRYIKNSGYPGGYNQQHPALFTFFIHASKDWLFENYNFFISEIEAGRMNPYVFSQAIDRQSNTSKCKNCMPYNSYFGSDEKTSLNPELVFVNSCQIGLDPYYVNLNYSIFKRGYIRPDMKTPLHEYYVKNKTRFNCSNYK